MKRCLLIMITLFAILATARPQFILEHAYPNASTPITNNQLYMVDLETLGQRYVLFNKASKTLTFFDLDHEQTQVIDLSAVPDNGVAGARQVLYITQHLFDMDDGIELMYFAAGGTGATTVTTSIVDESGAIIQSFPDEAPYCFTNFPQAQLPIYQTPEGAKMILSNQVNMEARVYGLPGSLPVGIVPDGGPDASYGQVNIYPNPASSGFNLDLHGIEISDDLVINLYSMNGQLVLQRNIPSRSLSVERGNLVAGQYLYTIARSSVVLISGTVLLN